jgi:SAM-dependent methyltransferase
MQLLAIKVSRMRRLVSSVVAKPRVYDAVQRLAGMERVAARLRPILAGAEGKTVLDVGAGTGYLKSLLPGSAHYIWLDCDLQKLEGFRANGQEVIVADATNIPLADASVDWSVSMDVAHHLDDEQLQRVLDEIRRVTREHVLFVDATWTGRWLTRPLWHYDRGDYPRAANVLRKELAERFTIIEERRFTVYHSYLLIFAK